MKLNYSALDQPITKFDIEAFQRSLPVDPTTRAEKITEKIVYAFMAVATVFLLWALLYAPILQGEKSFIAIFFVLMIAALISRVYGQAKRRRTEKLARLYKFAVTNRLRFIHDISNPVHSGMIFEKGSSRTTGEALGFPDGIEIGNYQYTTGSGKNRHIHEWSYARVTLARRLPHMVLDAKMNNLFGRFSSLPGGLDRDQILQLEGDFNNYFTLYAPEQYERDALYVFTPDIMAAVIDAGRAYDIEVVDDHLYLYTVGFRDLASKDYLVSILGIINSIRGEIRDQSDYYADERVGDRVADLVAKPGRRLKVQLFSITSIALLVFLIVLLFWFSLPIIRNL